MSSTPSFSRGSSNSLHALEKHEPSTAQPHSSEPAGAAVSVSDSLDAVEVVDAADATHTAAATTTAAGAPKAIAAFINIKLHPRKGLPLTHCRAPKNFPGPFDLILSTEHDSYTAFCSKVRAQLITSLPDFSWPKDAHPYLRPTHSATQSQYKELTEANFELRINKAWRTQSRRLEGTKEVLYLHIYVYVVKAEMNKSVRIGKSSSPAINTTGFSTMNGASGSGSGSGALGAVNETSTSNNTNNNNSNNNTTITPPTRIYPPRSTIAGTSVSPAIQAKMEEAERRILMASQQHIIPPLGPVSTEMFARHLAMLPTMASVESLELPTTLTFRQAIQLDEQARALKRRMEAEESAGSDEYRTVRIKVQGVVVPIQIELRSLREALGLQPGLDADGAS
ncbi:hypothetical protein BGZ75_003000 [Mortierella antarctica]|nr:hypothetical protein BGZ75_003000 [Mortierella antarctica]